MYLFREYKNLTLNMNFNSDVKHQGAKRFLAMVVSPNVKTAKSSPGFRLIIHLNAK